MHVLSPEQARALLAAAAGDPLEALYVLAVTAGLRQGELLALKWSDIDLDAARLNVCRSVRSVSGEGSIVGEPKTKSGRRNVLLTPLAVAALRRHRTRQTEQRLRAVFWDDLDLVFANEIGRYIGATNLRLRSFRGLLARAELPSIRFHDLRHTAATLLLGQNVNVKAVSEMMGHANIAITLDTYSHVLPTYAGRSHENGGVVYRRSLTTVLTTTRVNDDGRGRTSARVFVSKTVVCERPRTPWLGLGDRRSSS